MRAETSASSQSIAGSRHRQSESAKGHQARRRTPNYQNENECSAGVRTTSMQAGGALLSVSWHSAASWRFDHGQSEIAKGRQARRRTPNYQNENECSAGVRT